MTDILEDIIDALFLYSNENLIHKYLSKDPDYKVQCQIMDKNYDALQEFLTPESQKLLEDFIAARDFSTYIEQEANFRAGLVIGMNLARM